MISAFTVALPNMLSSITAAALDFVDVIHDTLDETIPGLADTFDTLAVSVVAVTAAMKGYQAAVAITSLIEKLKKATEAQTLAQAALNAVTAANPFVLVATLIAGVVAALGALFVANDEFRASVISTWDKVTSFIAESANTIAKFFTETIPEAANSALEWLASIPDQMKEVGKDLVEGLWDGIADKIAWLKSKISGVIDRIKSWFTGPDGFDEHSPSKWSKQVFRYVIDGGIQGLDEGTPALLRDVRSVTDKVKAGMDFGTATVDYQSSGIGNMARSMGNAVANAGATSLDGVTIVVQSVLDGRVIGESAYRYGKQKEMAFGV